MRTIGTNLDHIANRDTIAKVSDAMADVRGFVEMAHQRDFYERVFVSEKDSPEFVALRELLPAYYGTVEVAEGEAEAGANGLHPGQYLTLEDLTWGRQWPCIMDVKMGTRSYEADASAEKIAYEKSKFPLQEEVGFRIQGIKVFDPKQRGYVEFDKYFGRGITSADELAPAFRNYFPSEDTPKTIKLLKAAADYRSELERLLHEYEPGNEASAAQLLETYAGMEHELVECYRHYYAGKGSFRVALDDKQEAGSPRVSSPGPLHLPTSAIGTYLQAKLQSRRGGAARNAKLEDVRGPTAAVSTDSPTRRRPAAVVPRRRATSFTASLQHHEPGELSSSYEDDEDVLARRASTPTEYHRSSS
ncbi:unnamed protein product [Phytophthora lilii]|uniref:Kinase n=1 Tax=Phytophthora lilii TaxID=2077276 RepID=A0A9W6WQ52_9STRA|nr:unnamed protein product [Phytophthora lilii]